MDPEGGGVDGSDLPLGFPSNTGPDPLKNTKLPSPAFNGPSSAHKWPANDGPFIVVFQNSNF